MTIEEKYDVLETIEAGYNSKVFKVIDEQGRLCAIKRLRTWGDCRRPPDHLFEEFSEEIKIYQLLKGIEGVPQIYDFHLDDNPSYLEENYLVMSWVEGKMASEFWARHYDLALITPEKITKVYDILSELDKKGVIHNDLWATNILFGENNASIIDFNMGKVVNPLILYEYEQKDYFSNLKGFNRLFLDNFLADLYCEKGRDEFKKFYLHIAKCEYDFYKKKAVFMLAHDEHNKANYLLKRAIETGKKINNPETLEKEGVSRIFGFCMKEISRNKTRRIFPQVFAVNLPRVLKIVSENPELLDKKTRKILSATAKNSPLVSDMMRSEIIKMRTY